MFRDYSYLYTQESLLVVLRETWHACNQYWVRHVQNKNPTAVFLFLLISFLISVVWGLGWSESTAGRAFALHAANLDSIPLPLSERPAIYQKYLAHTAEPGKLPVAYLICQKQ